MSLSLRDEKQYHLNRYQQALRAQCAPCKTHYAPNYSARVSKIPEHRQSTKTKAGRSFQGQLTALMEDGSIPLILDFVSIRSCLGSATRRAQLEQNQRPDCSQMLSSLPCVNA